MSALDRISRYRRRREPENWLERALVERGAVLTADAVLVPEGSDVFNEGTVGGAATPRRGRRKGDARYARD